MPAFSQFASSVGVESAFSVLAIAKRLMAAGKDVIELEIGDSPFSTPPKAIEAGVQAIRDGHSRYGPSLGIMEFREGGRRVRESRVRVVGDRRPCGRGAGREEFRAALLRGVSEPRRRRADLQPALPHLSAERLPAQRASGAVGAEGVERLPAEPGRRAPLPRRRQVAARHFPEQPAQPDRRRGDDRGSERHRRARAREGRRGLQRRAVRPDGVARPPSLASRSAGHARADGRRLHLQQVVQHERVAPGICGQQPRDHRRASASSPTARCRACRRSRRWQAPWPCARSSDTATRR